MLVWVRMAKLKGLLLLTTVFTSTSITLDTEALEEETHGVLPHHGGYKLDSGCNSQSGELRNVASGICLPDNPDA